MSIMIGMSVGRAWQRIVLDTHAGLNELMRLANLGALNRLVLGFARSRLLGTPYRPFRLFEVVGLRDSMNVQ